MIKSIYIDGFRHFENFTLEFKYPYTLLCGLNGTGKTAVLEILSRLQLFITNEIAIEQLFIEADLPAWEQTVGTHESSLCLELEKDKIKYFYELQITTTRKNLQSVITKESLSVGKALIFKSDGSEASLFSGQVRDKQIRSYPVDSSITGLSLARRSSRHIKNFLQFVSENIFLLSINPQNISASHLKNEDERFLEFDASNFSAWYAFQLAQEPAAVTQVFTDMSNFIPSFKQFSLKSEGKSKELLADIVLSKRKYSISFDALSHGQKILSILHLLVRVIPENSTVAIDELENFLSPTELQPLYNAFQDAYEEKDIQFILISHHPQTLNWFANCATVLSLEGNPPRLTANDFNADMSIVDFLYESAAANEL